MTYVSEHFFIEQLRATLSVSHLIWSEHKKQKETLGFL